MITYMIKLLYYRGYIAPMSNISFNKVFFTLSILVLFIILNYMVSNLVLVKEIVYSNQYKLVSWNNNFVYGLDSTKNSNINGSNNNENMSVKTDKLLSSKTNVQLPGNTPPLSNNVSSITKNNNSSTIKHNQAQSNDQTTSLLPTTKTVIIVKGAALLRDKAYSPNPVIIHAKDSVVWVNEDDVVHTVTSGASFDSPDRGKEFDSGLFGGSYTHLFDKPGIYNYFCQIHPTMIGKIIVEK